NYAGLDDTFPALTALAHKSLLRDGADVRRLDHGLIPNSLMIGHHFSASAFTNAPSASGVCCSRGKTSNPSSASRDRTSGRASASAAAALSLRMISLGVPLGAKSPYQADQESVGRPISAKVGISGASARRASLVTA